MRPIVALLTDFGSADHYVGAVKGAVLAACPDATLVDICHELPPHDVEAGAFALVASYRAFPVGSVFMAVVDPGVGSERRGLALKAGGYHFVGPDNGIFSLVLAENPEHRIHALANPRLFRPEVSATFHARDIFGPVAGRLAQGLPLEEVGPPVHDALVLPVEGVRRRSDTEWEGAVLHVDRFGNLTTNVTTRELDAILATVDENSAELLVIIEGRILALAHTYADVCEGDPCALVGSSGRLEVAVHRGNASRLLGATRGSPVLLRTVSSY